MPSVKPISCISILSYDISHWCLTFLFYLCLPSHLWLASAYYVCYVVLCHLSNPNPIPSFHVHFRSMPISLQIQVPFPVSQYFHTALNIHIESTHLFLSVFTRHISHTQSPLSSQQHNLLLVSPLYHSFSHTCLVPTIPLYFH